jgi:hypothetical protein
MNQAGLSSILVAMALLAIGVIVVAQQPAKIPKIGFRGFRKLGYVEGQEHSFRVSKRRE